MNLARPLTFAAALVLSPIGDAFAVLATSAPGAEVRATAVPLKAAPALAAPDATALRIVLPAPDAAEKRALLEANAKSSRTAYGKPAPKLRPLAIGYAREVPAAMRTIPLDQLAWTTIAEGARVARIEVVSPYAAALRLVLSMSEADPDLSVRFSGNAPGSAVHGPFPANAIVDAVERHGRFVTPVLDGDTAIVELHVAEGADVAGVLLVLEKATHLTVAGEALNRVAAKDAADIGEAGACNVDIACVTPSAALDRAANSVAKLVMNDKDGRPYLCNGTLVNDSVTSQSPYVYTAAHCFQNAAEAASAVAYWFFRAQTCGSRAVPPFVQQNGGAALLARSEDFDWALLRLNGPPPAGTWLSAWRAEPIPQLAVTTGLHNPHGDLLKFSQGTATGYEVFSDGSSFVRQQWSQGTTEVGSSGSGLFTFLPESGAYELRGGLFGGESSCSNLAGRDLYSRMDDMLPLVRQYLTPDAANPTGQTVVVEFYNASLDHYFITADANEINMLDTGALRGWVRTGARMLAYSSATSVANPVCRFYLKPEVGDSHFYSADPGECERVRQRFGQTWTYESPSVFRIALPDTTTGACPASTRPVWRFFNQRTTNHRYTTEVTVRDRLRDDPAWIAEGYGPDAVIMCSRTEND